VGWRENRFSHHFGSVRPRPVADVAAEPRTGRGQSAKGEPH